MDAIALLAFLAAFVIPYLQELSSARWQEKTGATLRDQSARLEDQSKQLKALIDLVAKAIPKDEQRTEVRFIVHNRVALVRDEPRNGAVIEGKWLPGEVVSLVDEDGKWIEVEYYHWLMQEYQTGWALMKYFKRLPRAFRKADNHLGR